jgi:protein-S-isoprenylcysteine O-methyltransferase Ste14
MSRTGAALGTAAFLVAAPGVMAGLIPWWLTGWQAGDTTAVLQWVGWALVVLGTVALLYAFTRFVTEGRGTPAPIAPTERLVVGGLNRYVRNPMYLSVAAMILGQGLLLARPVLVVYAAVFLVVTAAFVRLYEEPTLAARYGADYDAYRSAVRGWIPRLRPWSPTPTDSATSSQAP